MPSLSRWQRTIVDDDGETLPGATVEVRDEATGNLASLKSDRAGADGIDNPLTTGADAFAAFYVAGGSYKIVATSGSFTQTWRHVAIGTAAELDQGDLNTLVGLRYTFASATDEEAAAGTLRANNSNLTGATYLYFSVTDLNSNNHGDKLADAGDSTSTIKGHVTVRKLTGGSEIIYEISGAARDLRTESPTASVIAIPVTYRSGALSPAAGDELSIEISRTGDKGDIGVTGATGATGSTGSQGIQGATGPAGGFTGSEIVYTGSESGVALTAADDGHTIVFNSATPLTVPIDPVSSLGSTWKVILRNIGAGTVTLDADDTSSPSDLINNGTTLALGYNEGAIAWANGRELRANVFVAAFSGARKDNVLTPHENLVNTRASASTVTVTADAVVLFDIDGNSKRFAAFDETLNIAAAGANGLDTGAEAPSTWYHLYGIGKTDGTRDGLLSASATSPTLPSGYTYKGYLGAVRNDGSSNFVAFHQRGNHVAFDGAHLNALNAGVATTYTAISLAAFVPPTAISAYGYFGIGQTSAAAAVIFMALAPEGSGTADSYGELFTQNPYANTLSTQINSTLEVYMSVPQEVKYYVGGTNAAGYLTINGWRF